MKAAEQLQLIDAAWRPLREAVRGREDRLVDEREADGWTVKELVAHIAFWEETVSAVMSFFLGTPELKESDWYGGDELGVPPGAPWPATDVHNEREARWARHRPGSEAVERWDRAHEKLIALVSSLTDEQLEEPGVIDRIAAESYRHYPDHLRALRPQAAGF